jgi:hypothetical protein
MADIAPLDDSGVAQELIHFLLRRLVEAVGDLIAQDRQCIANFGNVDELKAWKEGKIGAGFPAEKVLVLACNRKATMPVDHVYSLMGILGVRFPVFPAEGPTKALTRLLDKVAMTHNDVSVFNWSGAGMGSPICGRSMYPEQPPRLRDRRGPRQGLQPDDVAKVGQGDEARHGHVSRRRRHALQHY